MRLLLISTCCASVAGFAGGVAAQALLTPAVVHAQTARIDPPPVIAPPGSSEQAPRELASDRFVLTDANGKVRGELKMDKGNPEIVLYDAAGKMIWHAPGGPHLVY